MFCDQFLGYHLELHVDADAEVLMFAFFVLVANNLSESQMLIVLDDIMLLEICVFSVGAAMRF